MPIKRTKFRAGPGAVAGDVRGPRGRTTLGIGAELSAVIMEERVIEQSNLSNAETIADTIRRLAAY